MFQRPPGYDASVQFKHSSSLYNLLHVLLLSTVSFVLCPTTKESESESAFIVITMFQNSPFGENKQTTWDMGRRVSEVAALGGVASSLDENNI